MQRSSLTRRTGLKSRIRPAVPDALRMALVARSGGLCEATLPGCLGTATDPCHRVGQAQGGPDTLENLWHGCRMCHSWTHERVAEALDLGLMLKSWQVPELEPMSYRNECWALLGEEVTRL